MFYSGALTAEQTDAMYTAGLGLTTCEVGRWLTVGSPSGGGSGNALMFVHVPQGLPFGLLVHDMVESNEIGVQPLAFSCSLSGSCSHPLPAPLLAPQLLSPPSLAVDLGRQCSVRTPISGFLLYFFTQSAHAATRGTWLTPESQHIDRNEGGWPYASPGQANVPMALKWMLCFEHPETHTVWLAKATPRDWLRPAEAPLVASNVTTRYGRLSFSLRVASAAPYSVHASVTLPESLSSSPPAGGLRLRIRAPLEHAGKLSAVTLGGQAWAGFSAAEETVDILASQLTTRLIREGLPRIVATFAEPPRAEPEVR